jgi:hypothetical protein
MAPTTYSITLDQLLDYERCLNRAGRALEDALSTTQETSSFLVRLARDEYSSAWERLMLALTGCRSARAIHARLATYGPQGNRLNKECQG